MPYTLVGRMRMITGLIQGQVFVSAHTADPGDSGANEVTGTGYARKPITWNPVVNGKVISSSKPSLRIPSGVTVTHIGFWNALTGGAMRAYFDVADVAFQVEQGYVVSGVTFEVGGGPVVSPPSAPSNVQATTVSASSIQVTWSASVGATDYTVQRTVDPTGDETWVSITTTTATNYTDTGLTPVTEYFYRVVAFNLVGPSFPSATDSAITDDTTSPEVPTAPTNFTATAQTSTTIRTAWTPSTAGAESYKVQRLTTVTTPTDTTPPSIPILSASAASQSQINLAWSQSIDPAPNASGVAGYRLYRSTGTSGGGALLTTRSGATNTTFSDVGLSALTAYTYEVQSFDVAGNASSRSSSVTATTLAGPVPPVPPSTPTGLAGSAQSSSLIRVTWNAVSGATGYRLFRDTVAAPPPPPPPVSGTVVIAGGGDIATGTVNAGRVADRMAADSSIDYYFANGDIAYNVNTPDVMMQKYHPAWGPLREQTLPSPGNHDRDVDGIPGGGINIGSAAQYSGYDQYFIAGVCNGTNVGPAHPEFRQPGGTGIQLSGGRWYWCGPNQSVTVPGQPASTPAKVITNGWAIISLDNNNMSNTDDAGPGTQVGDPQYVWLEAVLDALPGMGVKGVFCFMHYDQDAFGRPLAELLSDKAAVAGRKADFLTEGHTHSTETSPQKTFSGLSNFQLYRILCGDAGFNNPSHFIRMELVGGTGGGFRFRRYDEAGNFTSPLGTGVISWV